MAPINQSLDVSSPGVEGRGACNFGQGGDLLARKPPPREEPRCGSPAAPSWSPWPAHRSTRHRRGSPAVTWKSQGEISTKALLRDHVWHNQGALKRPLWQEGHEGGKNSIITGPLALFTANRRALGELEHRSISLEGPSGFYVVMD